MCDDRGEAVPFEVKQIRSKFKKCCAECKQVLMTRQTALGIKNFRPFESTATIFVIGKLVSTIIAYLKDTATRRKTKL